MNPGKSQTPHWRTIDRVFGEVVTEDELSRDNPQIFLEKFREDATRNRARIKVNLGSRPEGEPEENLVLAVRNIIREIGHNPDVMRQVKYGRYQKYAKEHGFDPVDMEEFFKVNKPPEQGNDLPQKYRRHRPEHGITSRKERLYDERDSISMNWDHIFQEGFDQFDKEKVKFFNPFTHDVQRWQKVKGYREWCERNYYKPKPGKPTPKKRFTPAITRITPEGFLAYHKWKKTQNGGWKKGAEQIEYSTIECDRVK